MTNEEFAIAEIAAHARTLPLQDARQFLYGCNLLIGQTTELNIVLVQLEASDRQLELISSGQLKLHFDQEAKSQPT